VGGSGVFAALTRLGSRTCQLPRIVTPTTILRWHRALVTQRWTQPRRRTTGRRTAPRAAPVGPAAGLGELLVGLRRIHGELAGLGYPIAPNTVWSIPKRAGIDPAPRRDGPTWRQFLAAQAQGILATDFSAPGTLLSQRCPVLRRARHPLCAPCRSHRKPQRHLGCSSPLVARGLSRTSNAWPLWQC
jgi:hypothetical protein